MMLRLREIEIAGYRSFKQARVPLRSMNLLLGGNSAGKSNLLSVFTLLYEASEGRLQEYVARQGGASRLLRHGAKTTSRIELRLHFDCQSEEASPAQDLTYSLELSATEGDRLLVSKESMGGSALGSDTTSAAFMNTGWRLEPILSRLDGLGIPIQFVWELSDYALSCFTSIYQYLTTCRVYHINDTSPLARVRQTAEVADNRFLRQDGSNLPAMLYLLLLRHRAHYNRIVSTLQLMMPQLHDFILEPERLNPSSIQLRFRERGSDRDLYVSQLSDGMLRFACLVTLLLQPELPPLLLIDEPELGLHPAAIELLCALLSSAAQKTQVLVATQSVLMVDGQEDPENILVTERDPSGATLARRLDAAALQSWLQEYSLGDLWLKNVPGFGGRP